MFLSTFLLISERVHCCVVVKVVEFSRQSDQNAVKIRSPYSSENFCTNDETSGRFASHPQCSSRNSWRTRLLETKQNAKNVVYPFQELPSGCSKKKFVIFTISCKKSLFSKKKHEKLKSCKWTNFNVLL